MDTGFWGSDSNFNFSLLVLDRCSVSEPGLVALAVVEDLDVVEEGGAQGVAVGPDAAAVEVAQLALQGRPERFDRGVVGGGADSAEGDPYLLVVRAAARS